MGEFNKKKPRLQYTWELSSNTPERDKGIAESVKSLPCKYDLRSSPEPVSKGQEWWWVLIVPDLERCRDESPWNSLVNSLARLMTSRPVRDGLISQGSWYLEITTASKHICTHVDACMYIPAHNMHTHTHQRKQFYALVWYSFYIVLDQRTWIKWIQVPQTWQSLPIFAITSCLQSLFKHVVTRK